MEQPRPDLTLARAGLLAGGNHPDDIPGIIWLFMHGGPSHVDLFDPKPDLIKYAGQPLPESFGPVMTRRKVAQNPLLPSVMPFSAHGQSGLEISSFLPHIAECADDLVVIRSMKADLPIHSTGVLRLHTGSNNAGRPSLGSWTDYGLGSENRNLPGFIVLSFGVVPCGGLENFSNGFLPASHQATMFNADGIPIENIQPADKNRRIQEMKLALLLDQDQAYAR